MDYEKKYKELVGKMKKAYLYTQTDSTKAVLEDILPELKESEDELTWLAKYIEEEAYSLSIDIRDNEDHIKLKKLQKALAWLEKQHEKKEYTFKSIPRLLDMIEPTERAKAYIKKLINTLTGEGYITDAKIVEESLKQMNGEKVAMAVMDEKQGEQNLQIEKLPSEMKTIGESLGFITQEECDEYNQMVSDLIMSDSNNIEPKFKIGDWVVVTTSGREETRQIVRIEYFSNGLPQYIFSDGLWFGNCSNVRLWTIQDAKDGDVLISKDKEDILIYKSHSVIDLLLTSHISFNKKEGFCPRQYSAWDSNEFIPATKEQRNSLEKAMTDAGYEWNAEKKELKLLITNGGDFESENYEQKPAWSKEDEEMFAEAISVLLASSCSYDDIKKVSVWLRTIKQRMGG